MSMMPKILEEGDKPLEGVGILFYPAGMIFQGHGGEEIIPVLAQKVAQNIAEQIKQGTVICLPNMRDSYGNPYWDFRIEAGDPKQVTVKPIEELNDGNK